MKNSNRIKVVVFGETYSSNLGDGVIADCMKYAIKHKFPNAEVSLVDMSLRKHISISHEKHARKPNIFFSYLTIIKSVVAWLTIKRWKAIEKWEGLIKRSDLVIVGGGQLFRNYRLNFPLKIFALAGVLKKLNSPVICVSCGVAKNWSFFGKYLFTRFFYLPSLKSTSVRDKESLDFLNAHLGSTNLDVVITIDPAIFSKEAYKIKDNTQKTMVGLNIMDPQSLRSSKLGVKEFNSDAQIEMWLGVLRRCQQEQIDVCLFTNGSTEDNQFLNVIYKKAKEDNLDVKEIYKPTSPKELVEIISQMQTVVSYRLHANIISFALGIPTVGLIWDNKVRSLAAQTEREKFFLEASEHNVDRIYCLLSECLNFDNTESLRLLDKMKTQMEDSLERQINKAVQYA